MKKSLLTIIMSLCLVTCLTGCKEEKYKPLTDKGETTKKVDVEQHEEENTKNNKEIDYYTFITENHKVVVTFDNLSDKNLDATITAQFLDDEQENIETITDTIYCVEPEKQVSIVLDDVKGWNTFDIIVTSTESKKKSHLDQVKITHEDTGKEIKVKVTNTLKETIDAIDISVGYYDEKGTLLDYKHSDVVSLEGMLTGEILIEYPRDSRNRKVDFKTYKVYINEIYSEK